MAEKLIFRASNKLPYEEILIQYEYFSGFAKSQKQKCVKSLHDATHIRYPKANILEVSTASESELGMALSAFNLKYDGYPVENVFQSSKVFEMGGPYTDLLGVSPRDAKRDNRIRSSGNIVGFSYNGINYPTEPKTLFYDWIYINALYCDEQLSEKIMEYDYFTDISFNHKKSLNCQARAIAIYVSLKKQGTLDDRLKSIECFKELYRRKGGDYYG